MHTLGQHWVNPSLQSCATWEGLMVCSCSSCRQSGIWFAQGSGVAIGHAWNWVEPVLSSVVVVVVVVVVVSVVVVVTVIGLPIAMLPQYPPNKFQNPKVQVIPANWNGSMRLLHIPDMQSVPLLTGRQYSPTGIFARQHPTPNPMVAVKAQYSVVRLHPLLSSVQSGSQIGRSSASDV